MDYLSLLVTTLLITDQSKGAFAKTDWQKLNQQYQVNHTKLIFVDWQLPLRLSLIAHPFTSKQSTWMISKKCLKRERDTDIPLLRSFWTSFRLKSLRRWLQTFSPRTFHRSKTSQVLSRRLAKADSKSWQGTISKEFKGTTLTAKTWMTWQSRKRAISTLII